MRSDGRVGRRRWQARSAGAQRPRSLSAAACRAGSGRPGAGWLGWRAARAAPSPHRPHLLNTARMGHREPSGPVLGTVAYRALVVALGVKDIRFTPRRLERRLPETARALWLRACFLGAPRQLGEALESPAWAEEYQEIPGLCWECSYSLLPDERVWPGPPGRQATAGVA